MADPQLVGVEVTKLTVSNVYVEVTEVIVECKVEGIFIVQGASGPEEKKFFYQNFQRSGGAGTPIGSINELAEGLIMESLDEGGDIEQYSDDFQQTLAEAVVAALVKSNAAELQALLQQYNKEATS